MQLEEVQRTAVPDEVRRVHYCECGRLVIHEPALKCRQCGELHRLRCFYYAEGAQYIAECIDLNIAVERSTPEEAVRELQIALYGYLSAVFDGQDVAGLLPRPSPLSHRLRYHLEKLKSRFVHGDKPHGTVVDALFEVPSGTHCF